MKKSVFLGLGVLCAAACFGCDGMIGGDFGGDGMVGGDFGADGMIGRDGGIDACEPGTVICVDGTVGSCSADGVAVPGEPCEFGCDDSQTVARCFSCQVDAQWCEGDDLLTCVSGYVSDASRETCPLGCLSNDGAHCRELGAHAVFSLGDFLADGTLAFSQEMQLGAGIHTIDTDEFTIDSVSWSDQAIVIQGQDAPDVAVFACANFHLVEGGTLRAIGSRPLAIVARDTLQVDGIIDVSARLTELGVGKYEDWSTPGPGGFSGGALGESGQGGCGGQPGETTTWGSGSGAGGFGGPGGRGANRTESPAHPYFFPGGPGGGVCGNASLIPLMGGSGGGGGEPTSQSPTGDAVHASSAGGGGGGAVLLAAGATVQISSTGGVSAAGGGGAVCANSGGAGGGAGGGILIEAPYVSLAGFVAANGGGGAEGDCT
ncbi:MAG: hypothetical protein J7M25_09890 [Deltaproteobacteria bacterium]|nr:hypothetical protein [Deltaproteobacteria bacterium]